MKLRTTEKVLQKCGQNRAKSSTFSKLEQNVFRELNYKNPVKRKTFLRRNAKKMFNYAFKPAFLQYNVVRSSCDFEFVCARIFEILKV